MNCNRHCLSAVALACLAVPAAAAGTASIQLEAGIASASTRASWTQAGLDKGLRNGTRAFGNLQAHGSLDLSEVTTAHLIVVADPERSTPLGVEEAWIQWRPIPSGPWQHRLRVGAFVPDVSAELSRAEIGWTPHRTVSQSAINSWLSEEVRPFSAELSWRRRGALLGSPHDAEVSLAAFGGNDPDGTLIAWRGWSVGSRVTAIGAAIRLPDLPVYRPDGPIARQTRRLVVNREIDGRAGYYLIGRYGWRSQLDLSLMHFDSRGDPLDVRHGQYSWNTRFDHVALLWHAAQGWDLASQAITGDTLMGASGVDVRFWAAYLLASHALGRGTMTLRYDTFGTRGHDALPQDPNDESGGAWALAYRRPLSGSLALVGEVLRIRSTRDARTLIGDSPRRLENSLTVLLRWNP